jgi:hypothetical protein
MADALTQEIIGGAATVAIAGRQHQLAYPLSAVIEYKRLTGDNLFQVETWRKADAREDPERFLALLWVGLAAVKPGPGFSREQLAELIPFGPQAGEIAVAMLKALTQYFPRQEAAAEKPAPAEGEAVPVPLAP